MKFADPALSLVQQRGNSLFREQLRRTCCQADQLFAWILTIQWITGIAIALWLSPTTWSGPNSQIHPHVWQAVLLGFGIIALPVCLAITRPGTTLSRLSIAISQALTSALLIHLTGGRIESHFHVFASLALLAFYRDWRVLVLSSAVVASDHFVRGIWWPQSVYGIDVVSPWRFAEHAGWVVVEATFLILFCRQSLREMANVAHKQAQLEATNAIIEAEVTARTVALQKSEMDFRSMFELAGVGKIQLEPESGRFLRVNRRFCEMLGYSHDALTRIPFFQLIHPEERARTLEGLRCLATRTSSELLIEIKLLHQDGRTVWGQLSGTALVDADNAPVRILAVVQDTTARKQAEEALLEKEALLRQKQKLEAVGSLAGGMAHEFNNLLQVIQGYSRFAQRSLPEKGQVYQDLDQVIKAATRAACLTRQLLSFSRREVLQCVNVDSGMVVNDLASMLRPLIGEQIEMTVRNNACAIISGDAMMLQQMLLNICLNARDAMPSGGRLRIAAESVTLGDEEVSLHPGRKPGRYLSLIISDTGCGMTPEVKQRIFEPFFTTKEVGKGTGLGLAMVYGVVEQHHGFIDVESEPGIGTVFRVYLPIMEGEGPQDIDQIEKAPCGGTETILIAEDESLVRDLAVRTLTRAGYTVLVAADGAEAIEQFNAHRDTISLALLDVVMPKITGHQVNKHIKAHRPDTEVVFCSGYDPDNGDVRALLEQGLRLVQKPYDSNCLLRTVRDVLDAQEQSEYSPCSA